MATDARLQPTGAPGTARPPFDQRLSSRIDCIIIRLEATTPKTFSRAWMRLQKRVAERNVPAWHAEGQR